MHGGAWVEAEVGPSAGVEAEVGAGGALAVGAAR